MSGFQARFDKAIWRIVSDIPVGRVMGYGEVARAAGFPRHARMVSRAMSRSPETLPWYRVVRSDRSLAFSKGSDAYKRQQKLLANEGVKIVKYKVIPLASDKDRALDEILWGPDN
jgi:methylated-DNA-protein-cysteine methyltransferase-like protein